MRPPLRDFEAQRIALIKPSALGDIIHSLPVLTALRTRFPQSHITWVVNRSYEPLLSGHPDLDTTMSFDRGMFRGNWLGGLAGFVRFLGACRRADFDLVIDLQGLLRSGMMTMASRAQRRVGFDTAREGARWSYTDLIPNADRKTVHAVDRYWLVVEALGIGHLEKTFRLPVQENERERALAQVESLPRPWIFLGVGARWLTKRWPPKHFAELARRAAAQFGGSMIFIGSPDERDLSREVASQLKAPTLDLVGNTTLPELVAYLSLADVMIANDTGPLHLASALGRPVVAPFLCTKALLTGPYGQFGTTIESKVWCQGSYIKKCSRLECMDELTPDRLWPSLQGILESWQTRCA